MCQEFLDCEKHCHKEWISIETLDKIQEKVNKKTAIDNSRLRAGKVKAQVEYTEANKRVKRSIKTDKKKHVEDLVMTEEKEAKERNVRQLHDTTKKRACKYCISERPVRDIEGKTITEI